ncbi:hypothetical protein DOK78_001661 [Enterococcus sp. DIV2402]|uniref:Transglutaminase-like domain-containing protein n=1 Tax=Candidatus Enterococcus lowellii TaxID=2230877 RepID=A0ABZ2SMI3_9ENTE|nr:transglutaminase family protein [Enterococcus sp. DIV2402]MBO0464150.1 transglutaminase family protein [Enterococcus sp. DIV2402]
MNVEVDELSAYVEDLPELAIHSKEIKELTETLFLVSDTEIEKVQKAFVFVRDKIAHSWDVQQNEVTKTSLEVLHAGHGICYAKANLLAAILRNETIPTGFCYQRLLLMDKETGKYCIHALNAVYLHSKKRWVKLDARGNKEGIQADFDGKVEKLAFVPNSEEDEYTYPTIYVKPNSQTMITLSEATNACEMYLKDLPEII